MHRYALRATGFFLVWAGLLAGSGVSLAQESTSPALVRGGAPADFVAPAEPTSPKTNPSGHCPPMTHRIRTTVLTSC